MSRKLVLLVFISFFAISALVSRTIPFQSFANTLNPTLAETVHNLNTGLNYTTIQEAINAVETLDGHTIFVDAGTYYEHVVVNKSISLIGQDRSTTIIDGNGTGTIVTITKNNVNITGFTIPNSGDYPYAGIYLTNANHCNITENNITNNWNGIYFYRSSNNTVSGNNITGNSWNGIYFQFSSNNNTVCGNSITGNSWNGIYFYRSSNNTISGNNITNNRYGIWLEDSSNNTISGNTVRANDNYGVFLDYSSDNMVSGNLLSGNRYGFRVWGHQISHFMHSVDVSNLVDGKPVYYLVNQENLVITPVTHPQIGYLALVNSTGVTVEDVTLTNNGEGLLLAYTNNSTITNNTVTNNYDGIWLWESSNNSVNGNNITNNLGGVYLKYASNNRFYHNNFIDNIAQVLFEDSGYYNIWDNGFPSGGNYWSNYTGVDLNHDGIGDTPHVIDANNTDYYPLMGPIRFFTAGIWKDTTYYVHVVSNSTLPALLPFYFNPDEGAFLRFGVSGETETRGFCRVAIPKDLLWVEDGWTVYYGSVTLDYTTIPDENYTYLYFTYPHYGKSTTTVEIIGTHVIPEFPSFLILPLFMIATLLAAIVHRRKRTR